MNQAKTLYALQEAERLLKDIEHLHLYPQEEREAVLSEVYCLLVDALARRN